MPEQTTGGQLFGGNTKTASDLFGPDIVDDSKITPDPHGNLAYEPREEFRPIYETSFDEENQWDDFMEPNERETLRVEDPNYEENGKRSVNAAYFADLLRTDYGSAYSNHDTIANELLRTKGANNAYERIGNRFRNGRKQVQVMDLGYKLLKGEGDPEEILKQVERIRAGMSQDDLADLRNFGEQILGATAEQFPNMLEGIKASPKGAIPGGVIGALTAIVVGNMSPAAVAPEEAVTIPAFTMKGIKWGGGIAAANRIRQMEAGGMFLELLELTDDQGNKIDPNIARTVSHTVGAINGAIELAEWATILSTFGIGTTVFDKAAAKVTNKLLAEGTLKNVALKAATKYGVTLTAETAQEVWQESNNIIFGEMAIEINNQLKGTNIPHVTGAELAERYADITLESAKGFALLVLPGNVMTGVKEAKTVRKQQKLKALAVKTPVGKTATTKEPLEPLVVDGAEMRSEGVVDEMGDIDPELSQQAYDLAKQEDLGITSDREVSRVVRDKDGIVIAALFKSVVDGNYEFDVVVSKKFQDQGIGSALIEEGIQEFTDDPYYADTETTMKLHVTSEKSMGALDRRGFEVTETLPDGSFIMERTAPDVLFKQEDVITKPFKGKRSEEHGGMEHHGEVGGVPVTIYRDTEQFGESMWYTNEAFMGEDTHDTHMFHSKQQLIDYLVKTVQMKQKEKLAATEAKINKQTFETKTLADVVTALRSVTDITEEQIEGVVKLIEGNAKYLGISTDDWVRRNLHGITNNNVMNIAGPNILFKINEKNEGAIREYLKEAFGDDESWETIRAFEVKQAGLAVKGKSILHSNQKTIMSIDISTNCPFRRLGFPCVYCYVEQPRTKKALGKKMMQSPKKVLDAYEFNTEMITGMPKELIAFHNSRGGIRMWSAGDYIRSENKKTVTEIIEAAASVGLNIKAITKQKEFVQDFGNKKNVRINISTDMEASHAEAIAMGRDGKPRPELQSVIASARTLISKSMTVAEAKKLRRGRKNIKTRYVAFNMGDAILAIMDPDIDVVTMYHGDTQSAKLTEIWAKQNPELFKLLGDKGVKQLSEIFMATKPTTFTEGKLTQKQIDKAVGPDKVTLEELTEKANEKMCCVSKVCGTCGVCCGFKNLSAQEVLFKLTGGTPQAAVQFEADGRAMIFAWQRTTVGGVAHELSHIFRRTLDPILEKKAADWAGVVDNNWTREAEEKFATAFEEYLATGKAPTQELKTTFQRFKEWLVGMFKGLDKTKLSPEIVEVFDAMLGKDAQEVVQTEEQAQSEAELFDTEEVEGEMTDEDSAALEKLEGEMALEDQEEVEPLLYIGNVTQRMKKATATGVGEIAPFKEGAFTTKRNPTKMTKGEARKYLEWLKADILRRLELTHTKKVKKRIVSKGKVKEIEVTVTTPEIDNNHKLAILLADYGDVTALQDALGIPRGKMPFQVVRATKHTMKEIKDTKKRIYEAIRPTEDAKMTVGQVLGNTMKRVAQAARRAYTAGSKDGIAKTKEHYREMKAREKARKALKKRIQKAVKVIKKKPPSSVRIDYRRSIEAIQNNIDPVKRSKKTLAKRQKMREYLARATDEQKAEFPRELAEMLEKNDLGQYTVEELEAVADKIRQLTKLGKTKRSAELAIIEADKERAVTGLVDSAGGTPPISEAPKGISFSREGWKQAVKNGWLWTLRMPRILDWLDGHKGTFSGKWHRLFYDLVNTQTNAELKATEERHRAGMAMMEELGITMNDLAETDDFSSMINGLVLTKEQQMGLYAALKNREARDAIVNGNEISLKVAEAIVGNLDPKYIAMADFVIDEYAEHYEELREVYEETENKELGQEDFYTPMIRLELNERATHENLADQLLARHGLKKGYVNKKHTIKRKKIDPEHQKPIDIRLVSVWQNQVAKHEHYVKFAGLIKQQRSLMRDKRIKDVIESKLGKEANTIINNYISRVADPSINIARDGMANLSRTLRRNVAMAYLAYNIMTMTKQLPSMILYMKDAGLGNMLSSALEFAQSPREVWNRVREMDPQIKQASIERELADLREMAKNAPDKATLQKINKLIAQVGDKGMIGIKFLDGIVRTVGWNAVYQKSKSLGLSDAESARLAQNATLRTQPASSPKDIAQLYATDEYVNWFTMFTNQLNNIWNITTYDTYAYWNNEKYQDAAVTFMSVSVNAMIIWMLTNKRVPEDEDDFVDMTADTFLNMLPLLNSGAMAGKRGWGAVTPPPIQAATEVGRIYSAKDKEKQVIKALEANAALAGIPVVAIKRALKTAESGDPLELLGGTQKKSGKMKL
jgi:hypothetical protein